MGKLKSYQEQIQDIIEKGINNVEEQYKSVSGKPFELAEKLENEARTYSVKTVRSRHDEYVGSFYDSLRSLNKRLGTYASDLIAKVDKESAEAATPEAGAQAEGAAAAKSATSGTKSTAKKTTSRKSAPASA